MKTHKLTVTITADCTAAEAKEYVSDAVRCLGGAYHPDNPFFGDNKKVVVKRYQRPPYSRKKK